jgi:hypothetical protein
VLEEAPAISLPVAGGDVVPIAQPTYAVDIVSTPSTSPASSPERRTPEHDKPERSMADILAANKLEMEAGYEAEILRANTAAADTLRPPPPPPPPPSSSSSSAFPPPFRPPPPPVRLAAKTVGDPSNPVPRIYPEPDRRVSQAVIDKLIFRNLLAQDEVTSSSAASCPPLLTPIYSYGDVRVEVKPPKDVVLRSDRKYDVIFSMGGSGCFTPFLCRSLFWSFGATASFMACINRQFVAVMPTTCKNIYIYIHIYMYICVCSYGSETLLA